MGKKGVSFLSLSAPFLSGGLPNSLHPVQVSSAASSGPHIVFPIICASAHQTTYVRTRAHTHTHTHVPEHWLCKQRTGALGAVGSGRGGKDPKQKGMDVQTLV